MNIELPNGAIIEGVPDGTPKDEIRIKAIRAGLATAADFKQTAKPKVDHYAEQLKDTSFLENLAIGAGGGLTGMLLGAKQRLGLNEPGEVEEYRRSMAPVKDTT